MNYPVLDYLKNGINKTDETKNALIFVADTDEKIIESLKIQEENMKNNIENEMYSKTVFLNPNEIERIILRKNEGLEL